MPPKGIAVIAGVDDFPERIRRGFPELKRPEKSAQWMAKLARKLKYTVSEPLLGKAARVDIWKKAVRDAIGKLDPGDALLVSFSGHGYHFPEIDTCMRNGDKETWCFYDQDLVDEDMRKLLSEVPKDIRVFVVADCCYAAGLYSRFTVEGTNEIRRLHPDPDGELRATVRALRRFVAQAWRLWFGAGTATGCHESRARVLVLASCGEDEIGQDGCFMDALEAALAMTPYPTFAQLPARMRSSITACSSTQTPQLVPLGQTTPSLLADEAFVI